MKNKKKEISVYKYKLGKVKIWQFVNFKKYNSFRYNNLQKIIYIKNFLEIFFFLLTKISKKFFRYFYLNKKRKILFLLKSLLFQKKKILKFFFYSKTIKKKICQNIKILKKNFKFRFKYFRIKKKFFFNSIFNCLSFFLKKNIFFIYCNIGIIFKKKYFFLKKLKNQKKNIFLKKKKILLIQLVLLKIFLEKFFFIKQYIFIKFYFYNFNTYKHSILLKFPIKYLIFFKQLNLNNKKYKLKSYFLKKKDFFYNKLKLLSIVAFTIIDIKFLIYQFCERITKSYKHKYAIKQINEFCQKLNIFNVNNYGIKILIQGKINAKRRTKKIFIKYCKQPAVFSLINILDYSYFTAFTYTGTFGIHLWLVKQQV
jgi:hypothetical protein